MTNSETKPAVPRYSSVADIDPAKTIGDRAFTIFEEGDMLLLGLSETDARAMTPQALRQRASLSADLGNPLLLGS